MPVNVTPWFMPRPYVVTIHDVSSFLFGSLLVCGKRFGLYGFRRGLLRASCVIAVSDATRRDVENLLAVPRDRVRMVYSAPDPRFLEPPRLPRNWTACSSDTRSDALTFSTPVGSGLTRIFRV